MDTNSHEFKAYACSHCGATFNAPVYCGDRFCSICTAPRRRRIRHRLLHLINHVNPPQRYAFKHITLTIPNQPILELAVTVLLTSFRRLRQRRTWKKHVKGGAFVIEVTGEAGKWHAHLHIIAESQFFPVFALSRQWAACSPGRVVYIQVVRKSHIVNYLTKYLTKSALSAAARLDVSNTLRRYRLFQPFGSWHGITPPSPVPRYSCPTCGSTDWLLLDRMRPEEHSYTPTIAVRTPP